MDELGHSLKSFDFIFRTKIVFGPGVINRAGQEARLLGKKALIVTTSRTLRQNGTITEIQDILRRAGVDSALASAILPNPNTDEINRVYEKFKENAIDLVVGVGGGSSLDASKAVAILLGADHGKIEEYFPGGKDVPAETLPILAIPTTASGSEVSAGAILTDCRRNFKAGVRGQGIIPAIAVIDPKLSLTVPYDVTKFSGFDVFAHAFESFVSKKSNSFSQMLSREVMNMILDVLPALLDDLTNLELRSQYLYAGMLAGINLINVGTCLPHRMQYPIGAITGIPHGLGVAMIYPAWLDRLKRIPLEQMHSLTLGKEKRTAAADPIGRIEEFLESLQMKHHLRREYFIRDDIPELISRISGVPGNDPVYHDGIFEEIYSALRQEEVLLCRP